MYACRYDFQAILLLTTHQITDLQLTIKALNEKVTELNAGKASLEQFNKEVYFIVYYLKIPLREH